MVYLLLLLTAFIIIYLLSYAFFSRFNQTPLRLRTFDGSDQPYHPSVLFFSKGWNGYKYWMVETPYPIGGKPYKDRWECPEIHVSQDGIHWNAVENNPIDDLTEEQIQNKDFFSDPHLVFVNDHIECFYRYSQRQRKGFHTYLLRKCSTDGKNWSDREILADLYADDVIATLGDMVRSQAVLYENGLYAMWYVDNVDPKGEKSVCFAKSIDGYHWSERVKCQLVGHPIEPWHLDVNRIDGELYLTIYGFNNITLWKEIENNVFQFVKVVLETSNKFGSFYSDGLYRTSLIKDEESCKLYFSAFDEYTTSIGLMSGDSPENLEVVSADGNNISFIQYPPVFIQNIRRTLYPLKVRLLYLLK